MNRVLKVGDKVHLLMSPTNKSNGYTDVECVVTSIYQRSGIHRVQSIEYDTNDLDLIDKIKVNVRPMADLKKYYTAKKLNKLYFEDELNKMKIDMQNLNLILKFKQQQKKELDNYIKDNFPNWNYII